MGAGAHRGPGAAGAGTMRRMRIVRGRVVCNTVVLEGEPPPEGSTVSVFVEESTDGFHLDEASIRELLEAQSEIRRGHFVTAEDLRAG